MTAAVPRVGAVVLVPSRPDHRGDGSGGGMLSRVLVDRFGAHLVVVPDRRLASPKHARRAVSDAVGSLPDVDVVVLAVAGQVWHFTRRSGDIITLALPGSLPGRPGSMLPLPDLLTTARRPETPVIVCADLVGAVRPVQVAGALPGASVLVSSGAAPGSTCHDALAATLAETTSPRSVADILQEAALLAGRDRAVLVRHGSRPVKLAPVDGAGTLPLFVLEDMAAPDPGSRLDAVSELASLADINPIAVTHLRRLARADPDLGVRDFAAGRLRRAHRPRLPDLIRDGLMPAGLVRAAVTCPEVPVLLDQPGGRVTIGVDAPDGDHSCRPRHQVEVAPYRLGRTVVTNRQYLAFIAAIGHPCPDHWAAGDGDLWSEMDLPVVMVSWLDASRYCTWLTDRLHATGALPADWRVRLPSEVEWEAAAGNRAGDPYPWGTTWQPSAANTRAAGTGAVISAGRFPCGANATGCQDLVGNVWEWTRSRWGRGGRTPAYGYPYQVDDGRETGAAPDNGMRFVVRGGAYYYATECANSYTRNRMHATDRHPAGGFRVAATRTEGDTA